MQENEKIVKLDNQSDSATDDEMKIIETEVLSLISDHQNSFEALEEGLIVVEPVNDWELKLEMLVYIHGLIINKTSGAKYTVKVGKLIEIAEEIKNMAYGDVFQRASQYADIILKHKPFSNGTKQTALAVALIYLRLNYIVLGENEMLVNSINALDAKTIDRVGFAKNLLKLSKK